MSSRERARLPGAERLMAEASHEQTSQESTEIGGKALDAELDAIVASSLRPVCVGLALFYALLTGWYLVQYDGTAQTNMSLSCGLLSIGLLAGAVWFERNKLAPRFAHPAAALIACAIILDCLFVLVTIPQAQQTTNLMIAQLGFGCLLLSMRWFAGLSAISLLGWLWVVGTRTDAPDWNHFGLALLEATLFGGLVLFVRMRAYRNIQTLRLRDQVLVQNLRDANEAALCATRAKSEFLANMSHEIRTPMTAMLGMTELLQITELDAHQREYANTIERAGNTLLQIVNDILDFSKIEAGQLALEEVGFNLGQLLFEVKELLDHKAEQKGLALVLSLPEGQALRFRGDPTRIKQVVMNLVGNAIKFTHKGQIEISARTKQLDEPRWLVELSVADTGIGIPEDQLERVFEAFTQADASTTRRYGGTGLGLAISSRLTRLMGGELRVESTVGRGSTFSLALVLKTSEQRTSLPAPNEPVQPNRFYGRILVVEDNLDTQGLAEEMLSRLGCSVDLVNDGQQALARLEHERYDLVLMDCHMPNLNGYDTTLEIRKREAKLGQRTTVVALSASVLPEERARCAEVGMDDYVAKPFSHRDLERVLTRWLSLRMAREPASGAA